MSLSKRFTLRTLLNFKKKQEKIVGFLYLIWVVIIIVRIITTGIDIMIIHLQNIETITEGLYMTTSVKNRITYYQGYKPVKLLNHCLF